MQTLINQLFLVEDMPEITKEQLANLSPEQVLELQKQNCVFCHIISGKVPSQRVYEDDRCLAVLDINPASKGHVLLLPKQHYSIMPQIPESEIKHLFVITKQISNMILRTLKVQGTTIFIANGAVAGQRAPHFMIHIIPRTDGDDVGLVIPENKVKEKELDAVYGLFTGKATKQTKKKTKKSKELDLDKITKLLSK